MKNVSFGMILGIVLTGFVVLLMGADEGRTNLEKQIYEKVAERWGHLELVGDAKGDFIVVNKETGKARRVEYEQVNRPNLTVKYGDYSDETITVVMPDQR